MITPNRQKALQQYLLNNNEIDVQRVGFLKVEQGNWPAIVFNEGDRGVYDNGNISYEAGVDIFPILIDVVVKYEDYQTGYNIRNTIRKLIGKFNGSLTADREGTIAFKNFLAPVYDKDTNDIVLGAIYLLKQNYDYTPDETPTPTPTETPTEGGDVLPTNENINDNANNTD